MSNDVSRMDPTSVAKLAEDLTKSGGDPIALLNFLVSEIREHNVQMAHLKVELEERLEKIRSQYQSFRDSMVADAQAYQVLIDEYRALTPDIRQLGSEKAAELSTLLLVELIKQKPNFMQKAIDFSNNNSC